MDILSRFQEALKTPFGDLLTFLIITTLTLTFFYLYFWARFKRSKYTLLKYYYPFKRVEKKLSHLTFVEMGQADLFGKNQVVALADGSYGKSILFYPELSTVEVIARFRNYHLTLSQSDAHYFPKNQISVQHEILVNVETQYMKRDGKSLINFAHFCDDKSFTIADKEYFLINLAHTLEALHQLRSENGEPLYHGFLLPQSFYLSVDLMQRITNTYLAYHGCVFALGSELFHQWLFKVLKGRITIEPKLKQQLEKFAFILAPEQKRLNSYKLVNPLSDVYSFGALAVYIFTESTFTDVSSINFDAIPSDWRPFIKECLNENPSNRPQNFLELKEHLAHPELELSQDCFSDEAFNNQPVQGESITALKSLFEHSHADKKEEPLFNEAWNRGYRAIQAKSWDKAFEIFQEMMKDDLHAFNAHLGLALTHFYKGEHEKAKYHYLQAKKIDGKKISSFYRLIAFEA